MGKTLAPDEELCPRPGIQLNVTFKAVGRAHQDMLYCSRYDVGLVVERLNKLE